jgi:glycosyltransferase involved in cell wall biosynthesis
MKKTLIILPNDSLGGAEQILKMIACNSKESIIDVFFFKKKTAMQWEDLNGKNYIKLKYFNAANEYIGAIMFLIKLLFSSKKHYDYIYTSHVFITGIIGFCIRLNLLTKTKFIARESTNIFNRYIGYKLNLYKFVYKFGYFKIDLLICQTFNMKNQLIISIPKLVDKVNKIEVIENPVDLKLIKEMAAMPILNNSFEFENYIVAAGRLIHEKGFDILIQAFSQIKNENNNLKLLILGQGQEQENLEKLIADLELKEFVFLLGFTANVYPFFKNANVCVVSSRIEGFPNVLLQMMSQNNKIVSTKCAGGIDQIEGVFIADTNEVGSLKKAIINALEANTIRNKIIFESYLKEKSIENFIFKIENFLIK